MKKIEIKSNTDKKPTFQESSKKEIFGILWMAAGLFLLLTLASYRSADPTLGGVASGDVHNFGGVVGANVAGLLLSVFGLSFVLFPLAGLFVSWSLLTHRPLRWRWYRGVGFFGGVISLSGLLSLFVPEATWLGQSVAESGGLLGCYLAQGLAFALNVVGAGLVLVAGLLVSVLVVTQASLILWGQRVLFRARMLLQRACLLLARIQQRLQRPPKPEPGIVPMIVHSTEAEEEEKPKRRLSRIFQLPAPEPAQVVVPVGEYLKPELELLNHEEGGGVPIDQEALESNAEKLKKCLKDFGVQGEIVAIKPGPVVTMYEFEPAPGVKVNKIAGLSDDLAMALSAIAIRIVAPIPGRGVVGIEIPNKDRMTVYLKDILASEEFQGSGAKLPMALGQDIFGRTVTSDLAKMPHLLVAGSTGSGKSVSINTMILSLLYHASAEDVRVILIDPKMLELSVYEGIPHLLLPVVTEPKKAVLALSWAVREMERRYRLMADKGVRGIDGYNAMLENEEAAREELEARGELAVEESDILHDVPIGEEDLEHEHLPRVVVIVDELADLMMVAGREIEESIARLAQMARAAGIHLILATQRPSVDVITGLIKANFPTRISFKVFSRMDSRTILDSMGAENLLGMGDMLFLPPGTGALQRVHGAFVSDSEVNQVVDFLKSQGVPEYDESILEAQASGDVSGGGDDEYDEKWDEALALVAETQQASISMVQRRLRVGYNRAARMIEQMEQEGIVGPSDGTSRPREVFIQTQE